MPPLNLPLLTSGKTKEIYVLPDHAYHGPLVAIRSTDSITAGDGTRRYTIEGKGRVATATTVAAFKVLEHEGVSTHYVPFMDLGEGYFEKCFEGTADSPGRVLGELLQDPTIFVARRVEMIPVEIVIRKIAWGSYCKRYPGIIPGTILSDYVVEIFFKDDKNHDPHMILDPVGQSILFYHPGKPRAEGFISERPAKPDEKCFFKLLPDAAVIARQVFRILSHRFASGEQKNSGTLADLKIECGLTIADSARMNKGTLLVCDVIDADSGRWWLGSHHTQDLSKQVLRNLTHEQTDEAALQGILKNYRRLQGIMELWSKRL